MTEDELKIFIRGTEHFFEASTSARAKVSTPYVMESDDRVVYDFSAIIGVSGSQRGCVYYSAPRDMVRELVEYLGETLTDDEIYADYVGEIANTISGNARASLGSGFMISVPVVFTAGSGESKVRFPPDIPAFVVPLEWRGYQSSLIMALKENEPIEDGIDTESLEDDLIESETLT
jgi:chemotaxis protein CheX